MSVKVFDAAVKAKIKNVFRNTEFQSRDLTFKTITDREGKVQFPLISIFRPDGWSVDESKTWIEGREFLNGYQQIPIDLSYQIDIYASTREDLEGLAAEIVLYLLRNPGIKVHYESADGSSAIDMSTSLEYVSGPERTSEIDDSTVGRPYRYTLVFKLVNAYVINFAGDKAGEDGYYPKITEVIVKVTPEVYVPEEPIGVKGGNNG